jgi:hypothetical protein
MTAYDDWDEDGHQRYKDDLAQGYIYPDGTPRDPDPPDEYLEAEAERHAQIHRDQEHGGGECNCPVAEPVYGDEAPF